MNADRFKTAKSGASSTSVRDRSQMEMDLDNLIRRKLRVSDPTNDVEIAEALGKRYEFEKMEMEREATGLMISPGTWQKCIGHAQTSSSAELDQAKSDVERDMAALINDNLVKDIQPELRGWSSAINSAISDGVNAARFALDPQQRNRAFHCRRTLNDYARISRYVGALSPNMNMSYRRLAQSLDEVAAVLMVMMGEALARIGNAGGRFLMQVSASDLQERRDAVIYALRTFIGTRQVATSQNEWPRGIKSFQQFIKRLDDSGQGDLKSLLQENVLSRTMDELIDRAAAGNVDGLRSLGSTAPIGLEGFHRLIFFGQHVVSPESPPLVSFLSALQLFLDAFTNASSGYRLLFISRPPIVYYGLYGLGGPDPASHMLLRLAIERGRLAEMLDCYMGCECSTREARCQIMLDKILYDVDRAIDLYAQGIDTLGNSEPEHRAAAYGLLIEYLFSNEDCVSPPEPSGVNSELTAILVEIQEILWHQRFQTPQHINWLVDGDIIPGPTIATAETDFGGLRHLLTTLYDAEPPECVTAKSCAPVASEDTITWEQILKNIHHELCVQRESERKWQQLLQTMAPSCIRFNGSLNVTNTMINWALDRVTENGTHCCPSFNITIPPTIETSLDSIADDILRTGENREE